MPQPTHQDARSRWRAVSPAPDIRHATVIHRLAAAFIVLVLHGVDLSGLLSANPIYFNSGLGHFKPGLLPGFPGWVDFHAGATTQALGRFNADSWLHGMVPWWNPFVGIGLPQAAQLQSAAFFLPFVLLLHFPFGVLAIKVLLQILAGQFMFALLRHLRCDLIASLAGAVLYELNGSFAWFSDVPIFPIAFLPLLVLGVERAARAAAGRTRGGWTLVGVSIAAMVVAGFPETAYLCGLLALAWAGLRWIALQNERAAFSRKLVLGGSTGLLITAPCLWPFAHYLRHAYVGVRDFGYQGLMPENFAMYVFPYIFGPLHYRDEFVLWFHMGGYVGLGSIVMALAGLVGGAPRHVGLRFLLAAWIVVGVAKSAVLPGATELVNLIPAIGQTMFFRYIAPTLSFALAVPAAFAISDMREQAWRRPRAALAVAACGGTSIAASAIVLAQARLAELRTVGGNAAWPITSIAGGLAIAATLAVLCRRPTRRGGLLASGLLTVEACALFVVPLLAGSRDRTIDTGPIAFLGQHLGLARFVSIGGIVPNYGSYFRLASANFNELPVSNLWASYAAARLNPNPAVNVFNGTDPDPHRQAAWLVAHRPSFSEIGVRYLLTYSWIDPFRGGMGDAAPLVWHEGPLVIRELRDARPYYEVLEGRCSLSSMDRDAAAGSCDGPARLLRRELFFPGWRARVNAKPVKLRQANEIFQEINLPPGRFTVSFAYRPPYIRLAWFASACGLAGLICGWHRGNIGMTGFARTRSPLRPRVGTRWRRA